MSFFNLKLILQEIYSIKLPGNPKLGEGKPENQNHAIVFTRGNAVQTIDMNQVYVFANMSLFNPWVNYYLVSTLYICLFLKFLFNVWYINFHIYTRSGVWPCALALFCSFLLFHWILEILSFHWILKKI